MNPILLLVIEDAGSRDDMAARLGGRFGSDYTVEISASAEEALARLHALRDRGVPVAMVLADVRLGTASSR